LILHCVSKIGLFNFTNSQLLIILVERDLMNRKVKSHCFYRIDMLCQVTTSVRAAILRHWHNHFATRLLPCR